MIILGNIFIFILTPLLANKMEHHHTFGSKQLSCFLKMFLFQVSCATRFGVSVGACSALAQLHSRSAKTPRCLPLPAWAVLQVFNTVVASTVFYFWATPSRHSWYAYGASMVFNVLIGDTFFICIFLDGLQPAVLLTRLVLAPKAATQREMNALYVAKADIYVAFRLQLIAKFITVTLIYSSAMPLAYSLGAIFLWLGHWIDRVNLLRRFEPPPRSPPALTGLMLRAVMPCAPPLPLARRSLLRSVLCGRVGARLTRESLCCRQGGDRVAPGVCEHVLPERAMGVGSGPEVPHNR